MKRIFLMPMVVMWALATTTVAQSAEEKPAEDEMNQVTKPRIEKFDDWFLRCQRDRDCALVQMLLMGEGESAKRLLESAIIPTGDGQTVLQFTLPFGVDLRAGIAFRIDEHPELQAGFVTCLEQGCIVRILMEDDLVKKLRGGSKALVGFRPLGSTENTVIEVSLTGISAGMDALSKVDHSSG